MVSESQRLGRLVGGAILSLVVMAYSLVIAQQVLLGLLVVGSIWGLYIVIRLLTVLDRIASALERLAEQRSDQERRH